MFIARLGCRITSTSAIVAKIPDAKEVKDKFFQSGKYGISLSDIYLVLHG
jgi:hypothetical protein